MRNTAKALLAGVLIAAAQWAAAAPLGIAGALSGTDPTYNRTLPGNPPSGLSGVGTAVFYDSYPFYVTASGNYVMETLSAAFTGTPDDTFITLYQTAFNPATALVNALHADDDSGPGFLSLMTHALTASTQYFLVVTSFNNGQVGDYTGRISAGAGVIGDVLPGSPPGAVSLPASWALVPLALVAVGVARRRREH